VRPYWVSALSDGRPHRVAPTNFCETEPLPACGI